MLGFPSCAGPCQNDSFLFHSIQSMKRGAPWLEGWKRWGKRQISVSEGIKSTGLLLTAIWNSESLPMSWGENITLRYHLTQWHPRRTVFQTQISLTLHPASCVLLRVAVRAKALHRQEACTESRSGSAGKGETTNMSCSATSGKRKERVSATSLKHYGIKRRYTSLIILP